MVCTNLVNLKSFLNPLNETIDPNLPLNLDILQEYVSLIEIRYTEVPFLPCGICIMQSHTFWIIGCQMMLKTLKKTRNQRRRYIGIRR